MKLKNLSKAQKKLIAIIIILLFILLLGFFGFMVYSSIAKELFVDQAIKISENNQDPVFKIKKVLLYSSANAVDNSEEKNLKDLDISQYTDIAIYIDNKSYISEIGQRNTVKALKIDNIQLKNDKTTGIKSLTYKNPLDFAKFKITDAANAYTAEDTQYAPIEYNIVYNNESNDGKYSNPTFYTDCSDPITLSYLNRNIVTHYSLPDNSNVSFNGCLLKQAKIDMESLSTEINFRINIINNLDENFVYTINLNLTFDKNSSILNGYSFLGKETSTGNAYDFFKQK